MPLYTITTQAGVLSDGDKATLAGELTNFHAEYAGVPKDCVHIIFWENAPGNGFTAGEVARDGRADVAHPLGPVAEI